MLRFVPILVGLLFMAGRAVGQDASPLDAATAAYRSLEFDRAEQLLRVLIDDPSGATPSTLAEAYVLLGTIRFVRGDETSARQNYLAALGLNPDASPDPVDASPKIMAFFGTVRASYGAEDRGGAPAEVRYLRIDDPRPAAAMRSIVWPGWGQLYKRQRTKGLALSGAWAAGVAGTTVAHLARRRARDRYRSETTPSLVPDRFDTYNRRHKLRGALALGTAAVWLYAYVDAIRVRAPETISARRAVAVVPHRDDAGAGALLRVRF